MRKPLPLTVLVAVLPLALPALPFAVSPVALSAQEVELEMGRMNFGPVVSEEVDYFVRFGQNDGMDTFYRVGLTGGRWYASIRLAPTSLYQWSTDDTEVEVGAAGSRPADPSQSRWHYRVQGHVDDFVWAEMTGGLRATWGPLEGRVGAGLVRLAQTDPEFWGDSPGSKPQVEISVAARWRSVALRCRGGAVHVGEPFGRWSALEEAARDVGGGSMRRTLLPLACGFSAGGF